MSATVEELEAEVLLLPAVLRARLVEKLIASLDVEPDVENAWAEEVERREELMSNYGKDPKKAVHLPLGNDIQRTPRRRRTSPS